jgi:hypothetical protein
MNDDLLDVLAALKIVWRNVLRFFSQRARNKHLVWLTTQSLLPVDQRACRLCTGHKCSFCSGTGLEMAREALLRRKALAAQAASEYAADKALRRADRAIRRVQYIYRRHANHSPLFGSYEEEDD